MNETVQQIPESLPWMGIFLLVSFLVAISYSLTKNGIKEIIKELMENLFLWFLLSFGFWNLSISPVDADDEISAGIVFIAFGICRIAKHMARVSITEKNQGNM